MTMESKTKTTLFTPDYKKSRKLYKKSKYKLIVLTKCLAE